MGARKLKYSPSGPVVQNEAGGGFVPGEGMIMRSKVRTKTLTEMDATDAAAGLDVSGTTAFTDADSARRYQGIFSIHMRMDENEWTGAAPLVLAFQSSIDAGANWVTEDTLEVLYGDAVVTGPDLQGYNADLTFRTEFVEVADIDTEAGGEVLFRVLASTDDTVAWDNNVLTFCGAPSSTFQVNEAL